MVPFNPRGRLSSEPSSGAAPTRRAFAGPATVRDLCTVAGVGHKAHLAGLRSVRSPVEFLAEHDGAAQGGSGAADALEAQQPQRRRRRAYGRHQAGGHRPEPIRRRLRSVAGQSVRSCMALMAALSCKARSQPSIASDGHRRAGMGTGIRSYQPWPEAPSRARCSLQLLQAMRRSSRGAALSCRTKC